MRYAALSFKLIFFAFCSYLFIFMLFSYDPASREFQPPFAIFVLDTINLFIHEAGHLFLRPFGMWMHMIGGSFMQCFLPFALLVVTWRQKPEQIAYPALWLGENLVNVSVYIRDAPFKHLRLIAQGLIHDWNWLLSGNLDWAEPLGLTVFISGILLSGSAIVYGVYSAILVYRDTPDVDILE